MLKYKQNWLKLQNKLGYFPIIGITMAANQQIEWHGLALHLYLLIGRHLYSCHREMSTFCSNVNQFLFNLKLYFYF